MVCVQELKQPWFVLHYNPVFLCPGYTWSSVNHKLHYVDPVTGVHTNTIEGRYGVGAVVEAGVGVEVEAVVGAEVAMTESTNAKK